RCSAPGGAARPARVRTLVPFDVRRGAARRAAGRSRPSAQCSPAMGELRRSWPPPIWRTWIFGAAALTTAHPSLHRRCIPRRTPECGTVSGALRCRAVNVRRAAEKMARGDACFRSMHSLRRMSRTVLVVDDDLDLRTAIEEVVVDAGYHAVLAQNAEHALQLLENIARPCLVLLDYTMPGAGAEGFLSAIESLPDPHAFSVVLRPGMRGGKVRPGGRISGQLSKPFQMDDLLGLLEAHCGRGPSSSVAS